MILLVVILACAVVLLAAALALVVRVGLIEIARSSTSFGMTLPVRGAQGYKSIDVDLPNVEITFGGWHLYIVCGRWAG